MKSIYSETKIRLSDCVLVESDDRSPTLNNESYFPSRVSPTFSNATTSSLSNSTNKTNYSSTYDSLQTRFKYDKRRGHWSSPFDFYFGCTTHSFGSVVFSNISVYGLLFGGGYFIAAYIGAILLYGIPLFLIQTFLGQFSTSGVISAFRIAPLFKGIGYSIILLNLISLTYYGVLASLPLVYAITSLHSPITWMSCGNNFNTPNCSTHSDYNVEDIEQDPHAVLEFFRYVTPIMPTSSFTVSWAILCGAAGIWLLTSAILIKGISFIGKFLRCVCLLMIFIFFAIFIKTILSSDFTWEYALSILDPIMGYSELSYIWNSARTAAFMATWLMGAGWGNILTLGSYNRFRSNSEKSTYWVSVSHFVFVLMAMVCGRVVMDHFEDHVAFLNYHIDEEHSLQFLYICYGYFFASLSHMPNFWCFLFFFMLFLAELSAIIIQMTTVLTAIFDEFEKLRTKKTRITIALTLTMMAVSLYFCTEQGFKNLDNFVNITVLTHIIISVVLVLMTMWIYGRERFQCDLQFMLGRTISSFKIFLIRVFTPTCLVISALQIFHFLNYHETPSYLVIGIQSAVFLVAMVYMINKVCLTTGSIRHRLKQCFQAQDWHPVDDDNRKFYDEIMGTAEMLVVIKDSDDQQLGGD